MRFIPVLGTKDVSSTLLRRRCQLASVCLIAALAWSQAKLFAQATNGPDGQPLPGSPGGGGLSLPVPPSLTQPSLGGLENLVQKDMADHPTDPSGSVPLGAGMIEWKRTGEKSWTYTFKPKNPKVLPPFTSNGVTDGDGISHSKTTLAPTPGDKKRTYGPTYVFRAHAANCTNLIVIQYIERTDTLLDSAGKVIQTSKLGPGVDGGAQYPVQAGAGGDSLAQDTPGISGSETSTDQQLATSDLDGLRRQLGVAPPAGVTGKREFKFWTYEICPEPKYTVIGHWTWGFTIVMDPTKPPYFSQTGIQEPVWTAGS